jgi:hypothetical protein
MPEVRIKVPSLYQHNIFSVFNKTTHYQLVKSLRINFLPILQTVSIYQLKVVICNHVSKKYINILSLEKQPASLSYAVFCSALCLSRYCITCWRNIKMLLPKKQTTGSSSILPDSIVNATILWQHHPLQHLVKESFSRGKRFSRLIYRSSR